jgi:hypothetical protein
MYKYILSEAGNINWMALFALLTFMFVFITSVIMIFRKNNDYINKMASLPLEDEGSEDSNN